MSDGKRGRSLESIKKRIFDMKSQIDEIEQRETEAKAELVKAVSRQLDNETEAKSLANRVGFLEAEVHRVSGKHEHIVNQLDENSVRSEVSESSRKQLEAKEEEGYEKSQELETSAKLGKLDKDEKENKYKEAVLREQVLENDLKRVEENLKRATETSAELQDSFDSMTIAIKDNENRVNELSEKEDESKERINSINDQVKQVTSLEEEKVARQKSTERIRDALKSEIDMYKNKINEVEIQFNEMLQV